MAMQHEYEELRIFQYESYGGTQGFQWEKKHKDFIWFEKSWNIAFIMLFWSVTDPRQLLLYEKEQPGN